MEAVGIKEKEPAPSRGMPDERIVQRILGGEKELFEILIRRYNQRLYRAVRSYLKREEDVEDAMQEAYLKAFGKLQQFRGEAAFSTWLVRIGINEALLRKRASGRGVLPAGAVMSVPGDCRDGKIVRLPDNNDMDPEKRVILQETRLLIEKAIENLPEKYRIVYILKETEGMGHADIAVCLGISAGNVKVRLHRARNLLKEQLYRLSRDTGVFEFGNQRCDRMAERVMEQI